LMESSPLTTYEGQTNHLVYEFDGIKLLRQNVDAYGGVVAVLERLNMIVKRAGWDSLRFEEKPILSELDVSGYMKAVEARRAESMDGQCYDSVKERIEREYNLFKIISSGTYSFVINGRRLFKNEKGLLASLGGELVYKTRDFSTNPPRIKSAKFIPAWLDDENKAKYDDANVYPPHGAIVCPPNVFNMWEPFNVESIKDFERDEAAVEMFKNHVDVLCGRDARATSYVIQWIAQMFQHPGRKSGRMLIFVSNQGAGKGSLMKLLSRMISEERVVESTDAGTMVGHFNSLLSNRYLVCFNELCKKQLSGHSGTLKALITDNAIPITNKGLDSRVENSFHRFIGCTNKTIPINIEKGDRRFDVLRSSDELIRNFDYFNRFNAMISSNDALASIYEFLMGVDLGNFYDAEKIDSSYQCDLKEVSEPLYVQFMRHFANCYDDYAGGTISYEQVSDAKGSNTLALSARQLFETFKAWRLAEGYQDHNETARVLRFNIEKAGVPGISRGATRREGIEIVFNLATIREHFGAQDE
jgi:hypothetical protein